MGAISSTIALLSIIVARTAAESAEFLPDFTVKVPFVNGFNGESPLRAAHPGWCDGREGKTAVYYPVSVSIKTANELSVRSLQEDGFKVILNTWNSGSRKMRNPKRRAHWWTRKSHETMTLKCKANVWSSLKPTLMEQGPKCWRKIGFYGRCEHFETEDACIREDGCQWNPPIDVRLIDEIRPERYARIRKTKFFKELVQSTRRKNKMFHYDIEGILEREMINGLAKNAAFYRRTSLPKNHQATFHKVLRANAESGEPGPASQRVLSALDRARYVGSKMSCPAGGRVYAAMHNDLLVDSMRGLYAHAMSADGNRDTDDAGHPKDEYFLEMANFWTPLDRKPMQVNFLGFRVRQSKDDPGPSDPGGYHGCPPSSDSTADPLKFVLAPLVEGEGYLFLTRYQQHGAFLASDLDLKSSSDNCRTSVEFRFFFVGARPRDTYVPGQHPGDERQQTEIFLQETSTRALDTSTELAGSVARSLGTTEAVRALEMHYADLEAQKNRWTAHGDFGFAHEEFCA